MSKSKWQTAVIGYGGTFNMAKVHAGQMKEAGFRFAAACDVDPCRMKQASEDFPDILTFHQVEDLLAQPDAIIKENPQAFYRNIYQYLSAGEELIVKPEQAARVIAVIETTERSAAEGRPLPLAFERWEEAE